MKLYSQLFIVVIFATCQANRLRVPPRLLARQGVLIQPYENSYESDPKTLLIPDTYEPSYLRAYVNPGSQYAKYNPAVYSRGNLEVPIRQQIEAAREAELAEIDREALSKISDEDRRLVLSKLSKEDRKALLTKIEEVNLNEPFPIDENRFGFTAPVGGFAGTAAQIGAGAGGYIGGKLAGQLGAKLGAAAGAYLGAAAASRLESTVRGFSSNSGNSKINNSDSSKRGVQYGYGGSYGAVVVKNK